MTSSQYEGQDGSSLSILASLVWIRRLIYIPTRAGRSGNPAATASTSRRTKRFSAGARRPNLADSERSIVFVTLALYIVARAIQQDLAS